MSGLTVDIDAANAVQPKNLAKDLETPAKGASTTMAGKEPMDSPGSTAATEGGAALQSPTDKLLEASMEEDPAATGADGEGDAPAKKKKKKNKKKKKAAPAEGEEGAAAAEGDAATAKDGESAAPAAKEGEAAAEGAAKKKKKNKKKKAAADGSVAAGAEGSAPAPGAGPKGKGAAAGKGPKGKGKGKNGKGMTTYMGQQGTWVFQPAGGMNMGMGMGGMNMSMGNMGMGSMPPMGGKGGKAAASMNFMGGMGGGMSNFGMGAGMSMPIGNMSMSTNSMSLGGISPIDGASDLLASSPDSAVKTVVATGKPAVLPMSKKLQEKKDAQKPANGGEKKDGEAAAEAKEGEVAAPAALPVVPVAVAAPVKPVAAAPSKRNSAKNPSTEAAKKAANSVSVSGERASQTMQLEIKKSTKGGSSRVFKEKKAPADIPLPKVVDINDDEEEERKVAPPKKGITFASLIAKGKSAAEKKTPANPFPTPAQSAPAAAKKLEEKPKGSATEAGNALAAKINPSKPVDLDLSFMSNITMPNAADMSKLSTPDAAMVGALSAGPTGKGASGSLHAHNTLSNMGGSDASMAGGMGMGLGMMGSMPLMGMDGSMIGGGMNMGKNPKGQGKNPKGASKGQGKNPKGASFGKGAGNAGKGMGGKGGNMMPTILEPLPEEELTDENGKIWDVKNFGGSFSDTLGHVVDVVEDLEKSAASGGQRIFKATLTKPLQANNRSAGNIVKTFQVLRSAKMQGRWACGNGAFTAGESHFDKIVWTTADGRKSVWTRAVPEGPVFFDPPPFLLAAGADGSNPEPEVFQIGANKDGAKAAVAEKKPFAFNAEAGSYVPAFMKTLPKVRGDAKSAKNMELSVDNVSGVLQWTLKNTSELLKLEKDTSVESPAFDIGSGANIPESCKNITMKFFPVGRSKTNMEEASSAVSLNLPKKQSESDAQVKFTMSLNQKTTGLKAINGGKYVAEFKQVEGHQSDIVITLKVMDVVAAAKN